MIKTSPFLLFSSHKMNKFKPQNCVKLLMVSHGFNFLLVTLRWFLYSLGETSFANYAYKHDSFFVNFSKSTPELCSIRQGNSSDKQ